MIPQLSQDFIQQSCDYVREIYNREDFILCCRTIEECISEDFNSDYLGYIKQEWWEKFDDLDNNQQKEVKDYINDIWPDIWRG